MNKTSSKITIVFDGGCGICLRAARFVARRNMRHTLTFISYHQPDFPDKMPHISKAQAEKSIWVLRNNQKFHKIGALSMILRELRFPWPIVGWVLIIPVIRQSASGIYSLIAKNRHRISLRLYGAVCDIDPSIPNLP